MKNTYNATRPTWAVLDGLETWLILIASLFMALCGSAGRAFYRHVLTDHRFNPGSSGAMLGWASIEVVIPVFACLIFIRLYRLRRIGSYPTTYIYCFYVPPKYLSEGLQRQVVGFLQVAAIPASGEIVVDATSYTWNGSLLPTSAMKFRSTHVYGREENGKVTCHIRFEIGPEYQNQRNIRRGTLEFQLIDSPRARKRSLRTLLTPDQRADRYAGYLRATKKSDPEIDTVIRCKGYAEKRSNVDTDKLEAVLKEEGRVLFSRLETLMSNESSVSSLWKPDDLLKSLGNNYFGHIIQRPQVTLLDGSLSYWIDSALNKMLAGEDETQIDSFKQVFRRLARRDEEFDLDIFEGDVKRELSNNFVSPNEAEVQRQARTVHDFIKDHIDGDSLLDVGCGSGLVSGLLKDSFVGEIKLVDILDYREEGYRNLPFQLCEEGHPLPVEAPYDTVLLLNVLHHALEPEQLLDEAWKRTRKKLIIIEPVVGVRDAAEVVDSGISDLDEEKQIAYAAFVDWFYNRVVLQNDIPVHNNFTRAETWEAILARKDIRVAAEGYITQDIELAPIPHRFLVLDKLRSAPLDGGAAALAASPNGDGTAP